MLCGIKYTPTLYPNGQSLSSALGPAFNCDCVRLGSSEPCSIWFAVGVSSRARWVLVVQDSNLVDPASSHMLVSKIKPCMSKYKHLYCETANGSLNQL